MTPRFNATSAYTISATTQSVAPQTLYDGQPSSGSVLEGMSSFYSFQPSPAKGVTPPVSVTWTNFIGSVSAYVTNGATLPGPQSTACQWVCTNFTGCFMAPGDPCYLPSQADGTPIVYTIAIVGSTGLTHVTSTYSVTATIYGDAQRLQLGLPTTDIIIPRTANVPFVFDIGDASSDVTVSLSVNHGDVEMLVAHDDPYTGVVPNCVIPGAQGAQLTCYNLCVSEGVGLHRIPTVPLYARTHALMRPSLSTFLQHVVCQLWRG